MAAAGSAAKAPDGLPWPSAKNDLVFEKRLGRGYFGEVWQCRRVAGSGSSSKPWAVKKIPRSIIEQHGLTEQMEREIQIMRELRHPYIVELHFSFRDENSVYLGLEFAEGGGMFDILSRSGKFSKEQAAQYFFEVCDALDYLHTRPSKVVHRDIKPENILMDKHGHAKLADFGWSNVIENASYRATFCGTPDYLAPEMIRGEGHTESLDMWEMGVLLYEMLVGKSPFGAQSQEMTCRLILKVDIRFPQDIDPDAEKLIRSLCKLKPEERLTAAQAKNHAFVQRYHGRPTEPVPVVAGGAASSEAAAVHAQSSPELVQLQAQKEKLQVETMQILQAKSKKETELLEVTERLEVRHSELHRAKGELLEAQQKLAELKELEARQMQELQQLTAVLVGGEAMPSGGAYPPL